jgi:hypothetical protein
LREYSLTFLIAAIILALFFRQIRNPSWRNLTLMTLSMVLGIFLQYGLALLIISLNFIFVIELVSAKDNRKLLGWTVSQLIVLCAVVAVYYLSLKQQFRFGFETSPTTTFLLDAYWNGSIKSIFSLVFYNTNNIFDFTFHGLMFLFVVVIGFIAALIKKHNRIALLMLIFPMALTFLAACARLYPYQGIRQDIFLTPMIYVFFGFGINHLLKIIQEKWVVILLLLFITVITGFKPTLSYLNNPGPENMRPVAAALRKLFENGDKIYVYYAATPAFEYYYPDISESQLYISTTSRGEPDAYFHQIDYLLSSKNRIWMVFSHCYADECKIIPAYVSEKGKIELVVSDKDAYLYLIH